MNLKNLFSMTLLGITALFYYSFITPFKVSVLDPVNSQLEKIKSASEKTTELLSLNNLRNKKTALGQEESNLLASFIPKNLHTGELIYRLSGLAVQNRLLIGGIQFSVVDGEKNQTDKKLLLEMNMEGRYDDFYNWLGIIEKSSTLIDVESIHATKLSIKNPDVITFSVKMYTYGINID